VYIGIRHGREPDAAEEDDAVSGNGDSNFAQVIGTERCELRVAEMAARHLGQRFESFGASERGITAYLTA